jgi:hypothetical protein
MRDFTTIKIWKITHRIAKESALRLKMTMAQFFYEAVYTYSKEKLNG